MRIVIFTGTPALEQTPWWGVLARQQGIDAVLVCRKLVSRAPRAVWRRFCRNVAKHGLIFVPYRLAVGLRTLIGRVWPGRASRGRPEGIRAAAPVEYLQALDLHAPDVLDQVRAWRPDVGLSLGAPILRSTLFGIPAFGTLNLHLGQAPQFRGAPPAFWEVYTGAQTIGATVHWVDEGLDTGPILEQATAPIYPRDSVVDVERRGTELGRIVLDRALARVLRGDRQAVAQPATGRTFRFPTLRQRMTLAMRLAGRRAGRQLHPRALAKTLAAGAVLYLYRPLRDAWRTLVGRHPVRVFTYHRVSELCRDGMTVPPGTFRSQVAYVARSHDVVPVERAVELVVGRRRLRRPIAAFTFDDAYRSVAEAAFPVLAAAGYPGCCCVCTDFVDTDRRFPHDAGNPVREFLEVMRWADLQRLLDAGWSVAAHGDSHTRMVGLNDRELRREIEEPGEILRRCLGRDDLTMAYPFGGRDDLDPEARERARRAGYLACFSNFGGENRPGEDPFTLRRIDIGGDHETLAWKHWVHGVDLGQIRDRWRLVARRHPVAVGSA